MAFAEPIPSLRYPWNSVDSTATYMEYLDSISISSGNLVQNWVTSIFYAFYKFPWIPQIISVESMEQSDSISMESTQCFLLMFMQPWMPWKAMEEVEFYRIPRKPWNLICLRIDINCWENRPRTETFILNTIFTTNVVKKAV